MPFMVTVHSLPEIPEYTHRYVSSRLFASSTLSGPRSHDALQADQENGLVDGRSTLPQVSVCVTFEYMKWSYLIW